MALGPITYAVRSRLFAGTKTFVVYEDRFACGRVNVPFAEIASVRLYSYPGVVAFAAGTIPSVCWCKIARRNGRGIRFRNQHIRHPFFFEDRTAAYLPFVRSLTQRLKATHPETPLMFGLPPLIWWTCVLFFGCFALVGGVGLLLMVLATAIGGTKTIMNGVFLISLFLGMTAAPASFLSAIWKDRTRLLDPASL